MNQFHKTIQESISQIDNMDGFNLSKSEYSKFHAFSQQLAKWNKTIRLTGTGDQLHIFQKHIADSLPGLGPLKSIPAGSKILDVGTGAGFPAIPLAICRPDLEWHLVESRQRRAVFLQQLRRDLSIENMKVHTVRFDGEPEKEKLPADFHAILFRAVAPDQVLPVASKYLHEEGKVIYWGTTHYEVPVLKSLELTNEYPYKLESGDSFKLFAFSKKSNVKS